MNWSVVYAATFLGSLLATTSASAQEIRICNAGLWNHVYSAHRLIMISPCVTVTGTIKDIRSEPDGDYHVLVELDPAFANMTNQGNADHQHGWLVAEPVCEHPVTQARAVAACANFNSGIKIPPVGSHVRVTGSYVLDKGHYNWAEIHPATAIEISTIPEFPVPLLALIAGISIAVYLARKRVNLSI